MGFRIRTRIKELLIEAIYCFRFIELLIVDSGKLKSAVYYKEIKLLQLDSSKSIFSDRLSELVEYFKISKCSLFSYFLKNGIPNGNRYVRKLHRFFTDKNENQVELENLENAYAKSSFHYIVRLMFAYERYTDIEPTLRHIGKTKNLRNIKVLDYGCGVSDIGLLCAYLGCSVWIVDTDSEKEKFALWRYKQRGLRVTCLHLDSIMSMPSITETFDLIVASELLEHVPDPDKLLQFFYSHVSTDGYLYETLGPIYRFKKSGGDHLERAEKIIRSREYYKFHTDSFYPLEVEDGNLIYLYKKL